MKEDPNYEGKLLMRSTGRLLLRNWGCQGMEFSNRRGVWPIWGAGRLGRGFVVCRRCWQPDGQWPICLPKLLAQANPGMLADRPAVQGEPSSGCWVCSWDAGFDK